MKLSRAVDTLAQTLVETVAQALPSQSRETFLLRAFGFLKIPMLAFISPTVVEMSDLRCVVKVPLNRRSKNHLNSMYFAALAAGADCAGGLIAMRFIDEVRKKEPDQKVSLIFKDFHAEFLKRAEGDVYFTNEEGPEVRKLVQKAIETGERVHMPVHINATVPSQFGDEPVAKFILTLSLKKNASSKEI